MLKGKNISIRPIVEADLPYLLSQMNDTEVQGAFLPTVMTSLPTFSAQYAKDGFLSDSAQQYVICADMSQEIEPDNKQRASSIIGSIWAFKSVPYFDAVEVGYLIFSPLHRGKGFATEALLLLQDYLFESKPVNRIELRVATANEGSQKVASKAGFVLEGVSREAAYSKGKLHDMKLYAKLRREWQQD